MVNLPIFTIPQVVTTVPHFWIINSSEIPAKYEMPNENVSYL